MISLRRDGQKERIGYFRSYRAIGEYLAEHGETGKYWAIPKNIVSLAGIKEINVVKFWDKYQEKWDREIEMEGSHY